ncbi:MAG TPA: hypothetical protein VGT61_05755 [Thermomicrobiales bacterium]|jgi:hypothetical protein|nr:hypothetical protein [Thermomicrobiales bacterium]
MAGLVIAGLIVAVAISLDGTASRGVNGIGALAWIGSTAMLLIALRNDGMWIPRLVLSVGGAVALSFLVEPDRLLVAIPAFAVGGAIVAAIGARPVAWAMVVPGLWLPVHLLTAVVPAIVSGGDDGGVRTDPPATEALVPLSMILGAALGGALVVVIRQRIPAKRS